jgi:hypothetical protein
VREDFFECTPWVQAKAIGYEQIRQIEDAEAGGCPMM